MIKIGDIKKAEICGYIGGITGYATIENKLDGRLYDLYPENNRIVIKARDTQETELIDLAEYPAGRF